MVKQFYRDDYVTIELDDEVPCVKATAQGLPKFSEHFQLVQVKRLELLHQEIKNFDLLHLLTDSRQAGPILDIDVEFFKQSVLPEIESMGVKFWAIVLPKSKFTRFVVREMISESEQIEFRTFEDMREARTWLRSKNSVTIQ